jgi:raffinose/stachyose/melibiose transport system permease protein
MTQPKQNTVVSRPRSLNRSRYFASYAMLAPALILFVVFIAYPLLNTLVSSLYNYGLTSTTRTFIGLGNYLELFGDPVFWVSFRNNIIILVGSVLFQVGGGLVLAAICNRGLGQRWSTVARTIVFAPMVMSSVAVGILWQIVLNPSIGLLDAVLRFLRLPTPMLGWLGDPNLAIFSVLLVACWQFTGFMMVILLAGMQGVPNELYEAATLDGATETQSFFFITIPAIRNVIVAATLITMIGSFKAFDLIYLLTLGGPAHASEVLGTYLYKNAFNLNRMGYASAIAVVLLAFTVTLSMAQLRFQGASTRTPVKEATS